MQHIDKEFESTHLASQKPAKVKEEHLKENGLLLSDLQLRVVKAYFADDKYKHHTRTKILKVKDNAEKRNFLIRNNFTKEEIALLETQKGFDVTCIRDDPVTHKPRYAAIYLGKQAGLKEKGENPSRFILGEGTFGKVKLAQDQETKEWFAYKISTTQADISKQNEAEASLSTKAGTTAMAFKRLEAIPSGQDLLLMQLVSGDNLENISRADPERSSSWWMDMVINACAAIGNLHDKGIVHRDIKPNNLIGNLVTKEVSPVDFGMAVIGDKKKGGVCGTPGFIAPEIWLFQEYSKASDIYALGASILVFLELAKLKKIDKNNTEIQLIKNDFSRLASPEMAQPIIDFCKRMMDFSPENRPKMTEIIDFFKSTKLFCVDALSHIKKTGIFDIDEYVKANPKQQKTMITSLKACDEVVLIDNNKKNEKDYTKIQAKLESQGIPIIHKIYHYQDKNHFIQTLTDPASNKYNLRDYSNISYEKNNNEHLTKITPSTPKQASIVMNDALKNKFVSEEQLVYLFEMINDECGRLIQKYGRDNMDPRIDAYRDKMKKIFDKHETLSFADLKNDLKQLEKNINGTSGLRNFFSKFLPIDSSTSQTNLKNIINELEVQEQKRHYSP